MTREEARQIIAIWLVSSNGSKGQIGYIEGWFDEEDAEAFRMAIEVLSADRPTIVRCKDCKHWIKTTITTVDGEPLYDCPLFIGDWGDENGYCHHGERREP